MGSTNKRFLGWTHIDLATLGRKHGTRHETSRRARCGGRVGASKNRSSRSSSQHAAFSDKMHNAPYGGRGCSRTPCNRTDHQPSIPFPRNQPSTRPPPQKKRTTQKTVYHVKRTPHFPRNKDALIFSSPWSQRTPSSPVHEADEIESCPRTQGRPANRCPPLLPGPFGHPIYWTDLDPGQFGAWSAG